MQIPSASESLIKWQTTQEVDFCTDLSVDAFPSLYLGNPRIVVKITLTKTKTWPEPECAETEKRPRLQGTET